MLESLIKFIIIALTVELSSHSHREWRKIVTFTAVESCTLRLCKDGYPVSNYVMYQKNKVYAWMRLDI